VRIGVFGGSFDPPHNGHLALCLLAREQLGLDRLLISVSKNPFKSSSDAPDSQRKIMARLLAAEINVTGDFVAVSDWELDRSGPSYTICRNTGMRNWYCLSGKTAIGLCRDGKLRKKYPDSALSRCSLVPPAFPGSILMPVPCLRPGSWISTCLFRQPKSGSL